MRMLSPKKGDDFHESIDSSKMEPRVALVKLLLRLPINILALLPEGVLYFLQGVMGKHIMKCKILIMF